MNEQRPPLPPFSYDDAVAKVRKAEDGWNGKQPDKVALAYTEDSRWRNRSEFINGRAEIIAFLTCLLYTSPSPRDLSTSRMPSSA